MQMLSLSLAALGSLMWLRKNKPKTLIPIIYACAGIVATMPSISRSVCFSFYTYIYIYILSLAFKLSSILILGYAEINEFVERWCSYLRRGLGWHLPEVVGFQLFTSLAMALISWQLFSACQRPSA